MCAKMNVDNESSTASTCYTEDRSGREIEVCVCESAAGKTPCNRAVTTLLLDQLERPLFLAGLAMVQLLALRMSGIGR